MSEIRAIVDRLNEPPFDKGFSLVKFDEQQPHQLMLLLNEVLGELDPKQKVDMTREDPIMAQNRIIQFLHCLAYRPEDPSTFAMYLFNGEKHIIYPLLEWLLTGYDGHKKRAYLAPYMTEVDVPQELFSDETVMEIKQGCFQLKDEFVHSHKQLAMLEEATMDPQAKKSTIQSLDDERRQLKERVERLRKKLNNDLENFDEIAVECKRLRREQDDAKALKKRFKDQTELCAQAQRALTQARQRMDGIKGGQAHLLQGDAVTMLGKLQDEVDRKRVQVREKLPAELEDRAQKLADVKRILQAPAFSEQDVAQLHQTQQRVAQEVEVLTAEKNAPPPANDMLSMFRQQASMVGKKKEKETKKFEEMKGQAAALEIELEEKEGSFDLGGPGLSKDDFRRVKQDFRSVATNYKRMRSELNEMRAEKGVIQRTVTILEGRCQDMDGFLHEQEKAAGVVGFSANQDQLEKVSTAKADYDHRKGLTLAEHSEVVERIRLEINEKKKKLAPMIKDLRAARGDFQQLEAVHGEKKSVYDQIKLKYDCEFEVLNTDSDACRADIEREESQYHHLGCLALITDAVTERSKIEVRNKTSGGGVMMNGEQYGCYRDMLEAQIKIEAENQKQLRESQKWVKENHEPNLQQMQIFKDLHSIMELKLRLARSGEGGLWDENAMAGQGVLAPTENGGMANVFTLDD
jgi:intraflagellar transport protein 81